MKTLARETHTSDRIARSRRWLLPVIAALVLLVVAGGVWAIIAANQTDDRAATTELVDTWIRGWNEKDEDLMRSAFTTDAVIVDHAGPHTVDQHVGDAMSSGAVTNVSRAGELAPVGEDGAFALVIEFDWAGGRSSGDWEVEREGDLIARAELTQGYIGVDE